MQRFQKIFLTLIQTKVFGSALRRTHLIRYAAKDAGPPRLREDALRTDENNPILLLALHAQKDIDYNSNAG